MQQNLSIAEALLIFESIHLKQIMEWKCGPW